LADFDQRLNRYDKARSGYARCLELAKLKGSRGDIALTLNNLARLDYSQNRMEAARKGLEEALKIRRELAKANPDTYLRDVATTLNNLAVIDEDQKRMEAARKGYDESLKIVRELAKKNPDAYLPDLATTLNNLANLDQDQKRPEAARKGYEEALDIYQQFAIRDPERFQSDVARIKDSLGVYAQQIESLRSFELAFIDEFAVPGGRFNAAAFEARVHEGAEKFRQAIADEKLTERKPVLVDLGNQFDADAAHLKSKASRGKVTPALASEMKKDVNKIYDHALGR
jgi:tetratricopeptide (TPR) repeat protein